MADQSDIESENTATTQPLLTRAAKMPGLDGQKMSKSYGNTIALCAAPDEIEKALRTMPTDPARVRRTDPGDPAKCPVWQFHEVYSSDNVKEWVQQGCRSAGIGCLECKQVLADEIVADLAPLGARRAELLSHPERVLEILAAVRECRGRVDDPAFLALDEIGGRKAAARLVDGKLDDLLVDPADEAPRPGAIFRAICDRPLCARLPFRRFSIAVDQDQYSCSWHWLL